MQVVRGLVNLEYFSGYFVIVKCALTLTILLFLQTCIAKHESNGIDIIIALIVNSINPLGKNRLDLVLELKVNHNCLSEPWDPVHYDAQPLLYCSNAYDAL